MADIAMTAESKAGKGLRFLFAPQILGKGSLQPVKNILIGFVQMIAEFLATAQLIPATHRSLRPASANDARLGEVLALAYTNLRRPGTRLDQYAVFGGVFMLFGLLTIMTIYTLFSMLFGAAHAAITITFGPTGCSTAGTFFNSGCSEDMAQQWINALILGDNTAWWLGQTSFISPTMQAGLGAMFHTYSMAILVLAGFLVLYHLVVVIAGTAHEGRLGGKVMNQIWAPIRLVAAIGMLVPLGAANGLNSGQMIAAQVAKWGSGLASNTWVAFASTFTNSPFVILPPLPQTLPVMQNALLILVCQAAYNKSSAEAGGAWQVTETGWQNTADGLRIGKSWDYNNYAVTGDKEYGVCGTIEMLRADYGTSSNIGGNISTFLSTTALDASADIRNAVITEQRLAIEAAIAPSSRLATLAEKLYDSADTANTNYMLTISDILEFNIAVGEYRTALATGIRNAIVASTALSGMNMTSDAMSRGWVSAGIWFNSIAKINGMLIDYTKAIPQVQSNYRDMMPGTNVMQRAETAIASAKSIMGQMQQIAVNNGATLNEPLSYVNGAGSGGTLMDKYLFALAQNVKNILGNTTSSANEITAGTLPAFASGLALNTANPLAELSALGHRMVQAAFAANTSVTAFSGKQDPSCVADIRNKNAANGSEDGQLSTSSCNLSYMQADAGTSALMAAVSSSLVMAGITLAFVLPLLPFIRFLFGILTWIVAVFETVIAIPVVALAHIKLDGDGLAGPMARSAYMLLLQVFLRPVLMVFGLMVALLVFNLMIVALNEFYSQAVRSAEGGGSVSALAAVVYTVIYVALAYGLANASFKAVDMVPSQCLMWIGGATQQGMDGTQYVSGAVSQTGQLTNQAMPAAISRGKLNADGGRYF